MIAARKWSRGGISSGNQIICLIDRLLGPKRKLSALYDLRVLKKPGTGVVLEQLLIPYAGSERVGQPMTARHHHFEEQRAAPGGAGQKKQISFVPIMLP